jgi:hypothetical protein
MTEWRSRGGDGPGAWPAASFNMAGQRICIYCNRLRCSVSCPVQQLPAPTAPYGSISGPYGGFQGYGGTSSSGSDGEDCTFRQCRGTTQRGLRCRVTSDSPWADAEPLKDGGHYCSRHEGQQFEAAADYESPDEESNEEPGRDRLGARSATTAATSRRGTIGGPVPSIVRPSRGSDSAGAFSRAFHAALTSQLMQDFPQLNPRPSQ